MVPCVGIIWRFLVRGDVGLDGPLGEGLLNFLPTKGPGAPPGPFSLPARCAKLRPHFAFVQANLHVTNNGPANGIDWWNAAIENGQQC